MLLSSLVETGATMISANRASALGSQPRRGRTPRQRRRRRTSHPIERLGRWDGRKFVPVAPGSVTSRNVHVMSHGWAPGMGPVVRASEEVLRVWDPAATTADGVRFDSWYSELAESILAKDPEATVLGYTWIDASATDLGALASARSQARTDLAAHGLALALRAALSGGRHRLHLIGFSHGSKVVALAGLLLERPPEHLTLLDSPEGLLPVIGGALNDLTPYLRLYSIGRGRGQTFVDSYPSRYGVNYGEQEGVGDITEVTLDPASHPLVTATNPHAYAHSWYHASGNRDVGLAWSPLFADGTAPAVRQLRQVDEDLPWTLEPNPDVSPAQPVAELVERVVQRRGEPIRLSTESRRTFWVVRWRHPGEFVATSRVRWLSGPPDAEISLVVQGMERWRSRKGWSDDPVRKAVIPLGGLRPGPKITRLRLDSPEPAEVEVHRAAIGGVPIPSLSELQSWVSPAVRTFALPFTMLAGPTAWRLARTAVGCAARVQSLLSRKTFVVDDEPEQDQSAEA